MTVIHGRPSPPQRVLVVEDDGSDALVLTRALGAIGLDDGLIRAATLQGALTQLAGSAPSLAIVDLGLPDSRGPETVRKIRRAAPEVPLIVVSATAESEAALASLQEGADDYLVKGEYDPRSLDRAVRYARERRRLWTEAKRRSEALEKAERQLRSVVEANVDGMLIVDGAGVVRFANERARVLLGGPEGDPVGSELGVPMASGEIVELEGVGDPDRRTKLELRSTSIDWEGSPAHLVVLRDVGDEHRLQERLRQAQKMEALGQLTGGIAHDFNNVLSVILNGTELLGEMIPAELAEAHGELRDIEASARRATGMVRRLMGFSRTGHLRFETVDVRQFTRDAVPFMRRMLTDRVEVRTSVAKGRARIRADLAALQQILLNVTANARDAMPEGGVLTVECRSVVLDETHQARHPWVRPGPYERVSVGDSGTGMDREILDRIFDPFFTTKGPDAGTGLGMSMVYGLMKQHRGLVHVYSEPGRGTCVNLLFPSVRPETAPLPEQPTSERDLTGRGETVLVIEDEPALRRGLAHALEEAGYTVLVAENGVEGLEVYRRDPARVDLVVSDLVMPRLGGREVLREIRSTGDRCPFLLLTGYGLDCLDELEAADAALLTKPWTREGLLEAVQATMRSAWVRPDA